MIGEGENGAVEGNETTKDIQYSIQVHPYAESLENLDFPSNYLERGRFPMFKEHFRLLKEKVGE